MDGGAILWIISSRISGTLLNVVNAVAAYAHAKLMDRDDHLIFGGCNVMDYSTKGCTPERKAYAAADRRHHLISQSPSHNTTCHLLSSTAKV